MLKAGHGDDEIEAVLMNPANKLSEKPIENGPGWLKGEIKRAREKPDEKQSSEKPSKGKHLLTIPELLALPPLDWQIEGLWPVGGLVELYGPTGVGKSFLGLDWALSIASGQPWQDRQVKQGPVIYIAAEGKRGLPQRISAWLRSHKLDDAPLLICPLPTAVADPTERKELMDAIAERGIVPTLIVVDTLARCFGSGDENATKDMNAFVRGCDALQEAYPNATVCIIHHTGKDLQRGDRGSTALRGAADTVMSLKMTREGLALTCEKQKDGEEFEPIRLRLDAVSLPDGNTSCVVVGGSPLDDYVDPRTAQSDEAALAALSEAGPSGASYSDWLKLSKLPKRTFNDARKRLVDDGQVRQEGGRYYVGAGAGWCGTGAENISRTSAQLVRKVGAETPYKGFRTSAPSPVRKVVPFWTKGHHSRRFFTGWTNRLANETIGGPAAG